MNEDRYGGFKKNVIILLCTAIVAVLTGIILFLPPAYVHEETIMNHVSAEYGQRYTYIGVWGDRAFKKESFPSCVRQITSRASETPGFAVSYPTCDRRNVTVYDAIFVSSKDGTDVY